MISIKEKSVKEVWSNLDENETPLTLLETLHLIKQHPKFLENLSNSPILVPATEALYYDIRGWYPCIRLSRGKIIYVDLVREGDKESGFKPVTRKV